MGYFPADGDCLVGLQEVTGVCQHHVVALVVPYQISGAGHLGPIGKLFGGAAVDQWSDAPMPKRERETSCVPDERLAPIVVANELAALAGVADDTGLAGLDRWRKLTGELR